jgi:hypothetical protein
MVDGLEQSRPRPGSNVFDDPGQALEVFGGDHEIEISVQMFGKTIVAGEDAIGLALV